MLVIHEKLYFVKRVIDQLEEVNDKNSSSTISYMHSNNLISVQYM